MKIIGLIICTNVFLLICLKKPNDRAAAEKQVKWQHNPQVSTDLKVLNKADSIAVDRQIKQLNRY